MNYEDKVRAIISKLSGIEVISNENSLKEDLMLDSLAFVTLVVEIEDTFDIQMDESDMNPLGFETVQNVMDIVAKYCGDKDE